MLIVVAFCFAKTMESVGASVGRRCMYWDDVIRDFVETDFGNSLAISNLEDALNYRWSCLGRVFVENYAASLAQILHVHEVFVINDIDHIDWENVPYEDVGLEPIDVQTLHMIKPSDDDLDIDLITKAQVRHMMPKPEPVKKLVNGHVPFDVHKRMPRHLETTVVD